MSNTQISLDRPQWRRGDQETLLNDPQERRLVDVAATDEHARVIGWSFAHGGPLVVRGSGDWGVVSRHGRWVQISWAELG